MNVLEQRPLLSGHLRVGDPSIRSYAGTVAAVNEGPRIAWVVQNVDGGEKPGHFGGVEIGQGVGYASAFSKPEKLPGGPGSVLLRIFLCGFGLRGLLSQPSA